MGDEDRRWAYAAYRLGAFGPIVSSNPNDFNAFFDSHVALHDVVIMMQSITPKGRIPTGITLGKYMGPTLFMGGTTWFPWATHRNKLECATQVLNELRRQYVVLLFCNLAQKDFYLKIAKYGVIRRVGTLYDLLVDGPAPLFQTRTP